MLNSARRAARKSEKPTADQRDTMGFETGTIIIDWPKPPFKAVNRGCAHLSSTFPNSAATIDRCDDRSFDVRPKSPVRKDWAARSGATSKIFVRLYYGP